MNFSFGIITAGDQIENLNRSIESIIMECEDKADYEIIIVGGKAADIAFEDIKHIKFDETIKKGWITKKKNIIAQNAKFLNLVLMHDYVTLQKGWLDGFKKFNKENPNWLTCNNIVLNQDGKRYRDLCVIGNDAWYNFEDGREPFFHEPGRLLHYDIKITDEMARWLYWNGAFYCIKKNIALEIPLDESRCWGQGEDVFACRQWYFKYGKIAFNFNKYSSVKFLKQKDDVPWQKLPELR